MDCVHIQNGNLETGRRCNRSASGALGRPHGSVAVRLLLRLVAIAIGAAPSAKSGVASLQLSKG